MNVDTICGFYYKIDAFPYSIWVDVYFIMANMTKINNKNVLKIENSLSLYKFAKVVYEPLCSGFVSTYFQVSFLCQPIFRMFLNVQNLVTKCIWRISPGKLLPLLSILKFKSLKYINNFSYGNPLSARSCQLTAGSKSIFRRQRKTFIHQFRGDMWSGRQVGSPCCRFRPWLSLYVNTFLNGKRCWVGIDAIHIPKIPLHRRSNQCLVPLDYLKEPWFYLPYPGRNILGDIFAPNYKCNICIQNF